MTQDVERELKEQIIAVTTELYHDHCVTAGGGNISARVPGTNRIWITPSGKFKGALVPEDLICVDVDGNVLIGTEKPSVETPFHTFIYRSRPDVGGVVHTHAPYATAIGLCETCFSAFHMSSYALQHIPLVPYGSPGPELGKLVAERIGNNNAAFLQHHGVVTVAKDVRSAANLTQMIEHLGQIWTIVKIISGGQEPKLLPTEAIEAMDRRMAANKKLAE